MERLRAIVIAVGSVAAATALKLAIPAIGELPFLLLFGAVIVSALHAGMLGGIVATALSAVVANWVFMGSRGDLTWTGDVIVQELAFVVESLASTVLCDALRRAKNRARVEVKRSTDALGAERHALEARERVARRLAFLEEASRLLASSLDVDETLAAVTRLSVPEIGDWAAVDMLDGAEIRRLAVAHVDPAKVALGTELWTRRPPTLDDPTGVGAVIRTGKHELTSEIDPEALEAAFADDPALGRAYRDLGLVSAMVVPLRVRDRTLGAITFVSAESGRRFGDEDLSIARELARRAETAIEHALAYRDARDANRIKDEFLAVVSHELRTPLNAILGWASMLRAGRVSDVPKALETIERNARAQARLIDDVLDVSRIVAGKLTVDVRPVDLAAVLRSAIEVVAPAARAKKVTLESAIDCAPCPVSGDPDRLQQILWNLLSNAVKFTPSGGRVDVTLESRDDHVIVDVRDTGRGIPPSLLPHVFERFRQADSSTTREHGGLGLGLAIARHLVDLHGGTIHAASAGEGRGSTFTISLPLRELAPETATHPAAAVLDQSPLAGVRVLVCEDDADARALLVEALHHYGARVRAAAAADDALQAIDDFRPDVLVSDIGLPLTDGYALMREIRSRPAERGGRTPAIALTAYARSEDARQAFMAGFQVHVAKPFVPEDLVEKIANLAGRAITDGSIPA